MKKIIIIKVGSSSLVNKQNNINSENIIELTKEIAQIKKQQYDVILVTSGAIAMGLGKLGFSKKPKELAIKQACAAVGQASLMHYYEEAFALYHMQCAQILVSHDDFDHRKRMINLSNTLRALFSLDVIPIINENDALTVEEIKVGDNDTLSAMISALVKANILFLVSDIDGLYDKNPQLFPDATLIKRVEMVDDKIESLAEGTNSQVGTGGMITKIKAARIATTSGTNMVILNINNLQGISQVLEGNSVGTWFNANPNLSSKTHWLVYETNGKGSIVVDDGAKSALTDRKSILPKGVVNVEGDFLASSVIFIKDLKGDILAKGITNYSSDEIRLLKGQKTTDIEKIIGYKDKDEIIHANNMVILDGGNYGRIK